MGKVKYTTKYQAAVAEGLFVVNTGDWRYQRPVTESTRCCKCAQCWVVCPVNSRYELPTHYETDLSYCKGCGMCAAECYVGAIAMVEEIRD